MRHARMFGICLVAAVVVSVVAVASASAGPPEIGRCVKVAKGTGKYPDPGCQKPPVSAGSFEWRPGPGAKNKFRSSEATTTITTTSGVTVTCKSATNVGEYSTTNFMEDVEVITFHECSFSSLKCQTPGAAPGDIVTSPLRSLLGFITAPKVVGVSLESATGGAFAEFECGTIRAVITGSVIAPITPVSKMTKVFKEKFVATKGKQKPQNFQGQPKDTLSCTIKTSTPVECGLTSTDTVVNEELLEVNEVL